MQENLGRASIDVDVLLGPMRKQLGEARGVVQTEMDAAGTTAGRSLGSRIASGLKAGMAAVGRAVAVTAATGAVALAGLGIAGAKAGLETASAMEQAEISFSTMLGSGEKARAFLDDLSGFAAKTPFEFPELQTAASSLISAGIEASKVIPIMTSLGNATSGMGTGAEGVKRATVALQQMNAAGRITGEDLNQLRDAGVPVFDLLAAATGKSVEEVAKLAQQGKLGRQELEQLMGALESGKGLERFNGLMEAQSASLAGMVSTLKDTVNMGLAQAVKPWLPTIKEGLGDVAGAAQPFFSWLATKSAEMAKNAPAVLEEIRSKVSTFVLGIQALVAAYQEGDVTSDGFVGALERVGVVIRNIKLGMSALVAAYQEGDVTSDGFVGAMETIGVVLREVQSALSDAFSAVKVGDTDAAASSMGSIADSAGKLTPFVTELVSQLPSLSDLLSVSATVIGFAADHVDTLASMMPLLVAGIVAFKVAQMAANVVQAASLPMKILELQANRQLTASNRALVASRAAVTASTTTNTAATAANTAAQNTGILARGRAAISAAAQAAATTAATVATRAAAAGQWLLNAALSANPIGIIIALVAALVAGLVWFFTQTDTGRQLVEAAMAGIKVAFGWVMDVAGSLFGWLKANWPLLLAIITGPIGLAVRWVVQHWDEIQAKTRAVFAAVVNWIKARIADVVATARRVIEFKDRVVAAFTQMKDRAVAKAGELVSWVTGLPGRITSAVGNLASLLVEKGKDVVRGLWDGIQAMGSWIRDKVTGFVTSVIPGPIADALGISSPSKVAAALTRWVPIGMAQGMLSETRTVERASIALAAAAVSAPMLLAAPGVTGAGAPGGGALAAAARVTAAQTGDPATPTPDSTGDGKLFDVNVYPREQHSEQHIGRIAADEVMRRIRP